jgi:hypothetical protein
MFTLYNWQQGMNKKKTLVQAHRLRLLIMIRKIRNIKKPGLAGLLLFLKQCRNAAPGWCGFAWAEHAEV